MALANSKRPKASIVKQDMIGHALTLLQELPDKPKEDMSLREAVEQMHEPLKAALAKGYSYEDLAKMLSDKGIKISALTLKNYVPSGRRQAAAKAKAKRARKSVGKESVSIEQSKPNVGSLADKANASETSVADESTESAPAPTKTRRGRAKATEVPMVTAEPAATEAKRGRAKAATTEATAERETNARSTRGRRASTAKPATQSSVGRRRRSKAE